MLLSTLILTTLWHYVSLSHCVSFNKIRTVKVNSILFRGNDFIIYLLLYDVLYGICVCVKSQQFKHSPSMTCIHLSSPTHPPKIRRIIHVQKECTKQSHVLREFWWLCVLLYIVIVATHWLIATRMSLTLKGPGFLDCISSLWLTQNKRKLIVI